MDKDSKLNTIKKYWLNTPELFSEKYETDLLKLLSPVNLFLLARRKKALQMCGEVNGKKILDVGCGSGVFMIELIIRGAFVVGTDYSQKMLNIAKKELISKNISKTTYILKKADATKLPFKENYFDLILATGLTDYLTDIQGQVFLKEASRILKNDGKIIVSFPIESSPLAFVRFGLGLKIRQKIFKLPPIQNQFSSKKIKRFLANANLKEKYKCTIFKTMWLVEATLIK